MSKPRGSLDIPDGGSEPGPGQILFQFVRHWSRRASVMDHQTAEQGRLVLVTEAVNSLVRYGNVATVNAIAQEIGIDQSGASRLVKSAADAGYLKMQTSATDGRQRYATVTSSGRTMLDDAHGWQEKIFDQLTDDWSERQRLDFRRAMISLMERSYASNA
jgi:DNA-binding MarR family transcriptional regulator